MKVFLANSFPFASEKKRTVMSLITKNSGQTKGKIWPVWDKSMQYHVSLNKCTKHLPNFGGLILQNYDGDNLKTILCHSITFAKKNHKLVKIVHISFITGFPYLISKTKVSTSDHSILKYIRHRNQTTWATLLFLLFPILEHFWENNKLLDK